MLKKEKVEGTVYCMYLYQSYYYSFLLLFPCNPWALRIVVESIVSEPGLFIYQKLAARVRNQVWFRAQKIMFSRSYDFYYYFSQ